MSDGMHNYTYDAEGNVLQVDNGSTASYTYDALNHRVQAVTSGITTQYAFGLNGERVSSWDGANCIPTLLSSITYWNGKPISFYNGATYFQHQDVLGTERLRTAFDGSVAGSYQSFAFGDSSSTSGSDGDPYHFAQLDHDSESGTEHAQFRQYSSIQGRWLLPDLYLGSYDFDNPQSLNRYSYALNNPLDSTDPTGLYSGCDQAVPLGSGISCYSSDVQMSGGENMGYDPNPNAGAKQDAPQYKFPTIEVNVIYFCLMLMDKYPSTG